MLHVHRQSGRAIPLKQIDIKNLRLNGWIRLDQGLRFFQRGHIQDENNAVRFIKSHLGFYPTPSAILAFADELSAYKVSKGAVQFPYAAPIPHELIRRMVNFRVKENTK